VTDRYLSADDKQRLSKALLRIHAMREAELRTLYLSALETDIGQSLNAARHKDGQHDLFSIITACQSYPGALLGFVRIIGGFHQGNVAVGEVEALLAELDREPLLANPDRATLVGMLRGTAPDVIAAAFREAAGAEQEPTNWRDIPHVVHRLEIASPGPSTDGGAPVPPLMSFTDRVAHRAGTRESKRLHEWIDRVGGAVGMTQQEIRALCLDSRRGEPVAGSAAEPARSRPDTPHPQTAAPVEPSMTAPEPSGVTVPPTSPAYPDLAASPATIETVHQIRGNIPIRNPDFTGREALLRQLYQSLRASEKVYVLPRALHGLGGVGKTQLAVEYVYRHGDDYNLVWWISAEEPTLVLNSLATLCDELGLPRSENQQQTAETVMRALSTSQLRWLLVFDNADDPGQVMPLIPSAGGRAAGHVIITSRNQSWATVGESLEVNVFDRPESVELIRKRGNVISPEDADQLAERLGDLPLALDQAASWQAATGMPVSEYLDQLDGHVRELLSEGKPALYPTTVAASVTLAYDRLHSTAPAVAQLLELFAYLSAEPISVSLLRRARDAAISEPLRQSLREPILLNRTIRELRRYGLAKVDANQRIQVHRLVQLVLRESMDEEVAAQSLANVQTILASANPADPDDPNTWSVYTMIGPHVLPAHLIEAPDVAARRVALDQIRYLYVVGEYEGSRRLAEPVVAAWRAATGEGLGPDGELTLIATRHWANALRELGRKDQAKELDAGIFARLKESPEFGPDHEHTLATAQSVAVDLRIAGDYVEALRIESDNEQRHRTVFGDEDPLTLRVRSNLAVDLRMLGRFQEALDTDEALVHVWEQTVGTSDPRYMIYVGNLVMDLYCRGRYAEALARQVEVFPAFQQVLGPRHTFVLRSARNIAIALRKTGRYKEALARSLDLRTDYRNHFGLDHEYTLLANMTYANALRVAGEPGEARSVAADTVMRYRRHFGPDHPLTLVAQGNLAIILRAVGELREARALDESTVEEITRKLGARHPYTLCVVSNRANDLFFAHDVAGARAVSENILEVSRDVRGHNHPYTLACATNAALDMQATGAETAGQQLLDETVASFGRVLGADHPETIDASRFKRAECDIEPPPT
jgi:tetratricopeptide (TPR) repeat protein